MDALSDRADHSVRARSHDLDQAYTGFAQAELYESGHGRERGSFCTDGICGRGERTVECLGFCEYLSDICERQTDIDILEFPFTKKSMIASQS